MGLYIDDLEISYSAKNILHELGFTMVSDLEGHDYISLMLPLSFRNLTASDICCPRKMQ